MRVLHITSSFPRQEGDHQAPFLLDLALAQSRAGMDVVVVAPHGPGLARRERIAGIEVRRFRYGPDRAEKLAYRGGLMSTARRPSGWLALPGFFVGGVGTALRAVRELEPDVVHAHWWLPSGAIALAAVRLGGVRTPVVVTCHGSDVSLAGRWVLGRGRLARRLLQRVAVLGAVSTPLAAEVASLTGREVDVLRMPLATGVIPGVGGPAPFPPRPPLRMLCAGRLMPEKGFDLAIAAANLLADRGVEVSLDIMGDGPLRGSLEAAAAAARAPVRVLPGGRSELWKAIDAAHVVLAPSRREGLGLVALEALARGRPVIATRVGGLVEVVECPDDGALVAPEDAGALAKAVEELAIAHPRARAAAAHSPEAVIEAHLRAYQRAAGRVASRGSGASRG